MDKIIKYEDYTITISVDEYGYPHVTFDIPFSSHAIPISYPIFHQHAIPHINVDETDPIVSLEYFNNFITRMYDAQCAAELACNFVQNTFRLQESNPAGSIEDRIHAVAEIARRHEAEGNPNPPSQNEIDEAIASCYKKDERTKTIQDLDAIYNVFALNDPESQDIINTVYLLARDYIAKRENQIYIHTMPPDIYDAEEDKTADILRTKAHNAFITEMITLAKHAKVFNMNNTITAIADMDDPYSTLNRNIIANMAYDIGFDDRFI